MAATKSGLKPTNKRATKSEDVKVDIEHTEEVVVETPDEVADGNSENVEVSDDTVTVTEPVTVAEEPNESKTNKGLVKICLSKDHRCVIGGSVWDFKKGEVYSVPSNVKAVLRRGDLLRPIN